MKKSYFIIAFLVFGGIFVACGDDGYEDEPFESDGHPEVAAEGVYVGTWAQILTGDSVFAEGTVTVTATDSAYCADVAYFCEDFEMDLVSVANITYARSTTRFYFSNYVEDNGMGAVFAGIIEDGDATATISIGDYDYYFTGTKQ